MAGFAAAQRCAEGYFPSRADAKVPNTPGNWGHLRLLAQAAYFSSGSRGRPRMRSAMVLRVISEVPPAIVIARLPK